MSKRIYLFLLLLSLLKGMEVPDRLKDICPNGCKAYFYCDEKSQKCKFKGFFPLYPLELLELFALMISSSLATSCGIGGGIVYSSMILGVEELEPNQAFPISNVLILSCGFVTFISFTLDKYKHPKSPFVHYDMATIFAPSMLVGTKFGAILNRILPTSLLLILLSFLIIFSTKKTYNNIQKAKAREAQIIDKEKFLLNNSNNDNKNSNNFAQNNNIQNNLDTKLISNNNIEEKEKLNEEQLKLIKEEDNPLNWERISYILFLESIVIIDQLIEGSNKVPSFIGIKRCSFLYWLCFLIYVVIALYFVKVSLKKVNESIEKKKKIFPDFKSEVIDNVEKNTAFVI